MIIEPVIFGKFYQFHQKFIILFSNLFHTFILLYIFISVYKGITIFCLITMLLIILNDNF